MIIENLNVSLYVILMHSMDNFFRSKIFHPHLSSSGFRDISQKLFSTLNFESYFDGLANKKIRVKYFYMDYKSASYIDIDYIGYDILLHIASEIETV